MQDSLYTNQIVSTPYGNGRVKQVREIHVEVEPLQWTLARAQKPVFYINKQAVSPLFFVGDQVSTFAGDGVIEAIRSEDAVYIVTLHKWRLAQGQSPKLYLQKQSLRKPQNAVLEEVAHEEKKSEDSSSFESKLKRCIELKNNGTAFYKLQDFENALIMYTNALSVITYMGDKLSNDEKASLMEQSVPCHNNMSLCSLKLNKWAYCVLYANIAIQLISSLEAQIPQGSKVWECLQERGVDMDTLLKKWKKRSYYLAGKGYTGALELKNAKESYQQALQLIVNDSEYVKETSELTKLIADTSKKIAKENRIEKKMWTKAFSGSGEEEEKTPVSSPKKSAERKEEAETQEEDVDISKFGFPSVPSNKASKPSGSDASSAVAVKNKYSSYIGALLFASALGALFGFSYFRFKRR